MDIARGDVEGLMVALEFNIAMIAKYLKAEGIDLKKVDSIVGEAADLIQDRAQLMDCGTAAEMGVISVVVMTLMHGVLKAQEALISSIASEHGVNRNVLIDEMVNETVWGKETK